MKNLAVVTGGATACALALIVVGAATARPEATTIKVSTAMNAAREVPAPTGNVAGARGTFTATATKSGTGATVRWTMRFDGLTGPAAAAHIHTGRTGQAGPVAVALCGPCQSSESGTATATAAVLAALQNGGAYVNVHTATNGAGEIRGQLGVTAGIRTTLNSRQEVPRPVRAGLARGSFTATVTKSGRSARLSWRLTFARLTGQAVAAHIHIGPRGRAGGVAIALCGPCRSGVRRQNVTLRPAVVAALQAGRAYVNVHTGQNPAGEIRGQIAPVPLTIS